MRGIALEKNGPCSWENEVKKYQKNAPILAIWGVPEMALLVKLFFLAFLCIDPVGFNVIC